MTDAWGILINATMHAAAGIARERNLNVDAGRLTDALKTTLKASIADVLSEWKDAVDAGLSEGWLQVMINTQAIELANRAIESIS